MEFIGGILGTLGAAVGGVASGGILALITAGIKGVGAYAKRKQEAAQRKEEWANEMKLEELRQAGKNQDTENELKIQQSVGSWKGLEASYRTVIAPSSVHRWVNDVRSLFRPFLTVFLLVMVWSVFNQLMAVLKGDGVALSAAFSPEEAGGLIKYIATSLVFTAFTAATWWYGDRALTPAGAKRR